MLMPMNRLLPFMMIFLIACGSGKKALQKGEYKDAVLRSIKRLRSSPSNRKAGETLSQAYPNLLAYYQDKIETTRLETSPLRWERIMDYYKDLNEVYDEIQRSPAAKSLLPNAQNFQGEYTQVRRRAAEARYALGNDALEDGTREGAKQAFSHFETALELRPNFRDAASKMQEAQELATVWVQVKPIPIHSIRFEISNDFFQREIGDYLTQREHSPFVRFVLPGHPRPHPKPHHVIELTFDDFSVGNTYEKETVAERVQDSVVLRTRRVGDSTVNVYGTVKAEVHCFQKEISSTGLLRMRILETDRGRLLEEEQFGGTFVWYDYWGYFEGDKRALEEDDEKFMKKNRPGPEPYPQDLFVEFTRPIYDDLTDYLRRYYRNY